MAQEKSSEYKKAIIDATNQIVESLNNTSEKINRSVESFVDSLFATVDEMESKTKSSKESMIGKFGTEEEWTEVVNRITQETIDRLEGEQVTETEKVEEPALKWPNPSRLEIQNPVFEAIWQCIKKWDIAVPNAYVGYCGATGNHVKAIMDALTDAGFGVHDRKMLDKNARKTIDGLKGSLQFLNALLINTKA